MLGKEILPTVVVYDCGTTRYNWADEVDRCSRKPGEAVYHHFIVRGSKRFGFGEHIEVIDRYKLL